MTSRLHFVFASAACLARDSDASRGSTLGLSLPRGFDDIQRALFAGLPAHILLPFFLAPTFFVFWVWGDPSLAICILFRLSKTPGWGLDPLGLASGERGTVQSDRELVGRLLPSTGCMGILGRPPESRCEMGLVVLLGNELVLRNWSNEL